MKGLIHTAFVTRRPALGPNPVTRTPAARNVRAFENYSVQEAPDPIRQGDTPARPSRQQIVTFLSIAPYKAVMRDDFTFVTLQPNNPAATLAGPGRMQNWRERANIHKETADAYGNYLPLIRAVDPGEDNQFLK